MVNLPAACPNKSAVDDGQLLFKCWVCKERCSGAKAVKAEGVRGIGLCLDCEKEVVG